MSGIKTIVDSVSPNPTPKDELTRMGLEILFSPNRYGEPSGEYLHLRRNIVLQPDMLEAYESSLTSDHLEEIFKTAKVSDIELYEIPFWKKKIESSVSDKVIEESSYAIWADRRGEVFSAASIIPDFDWMPLFTAMVAHQAPVSYVRHSFKRAAEGLIETAPDKFRAYTEGEVFYSKTKPGYALRGYLYSEYVKNGHLTKKTARKIRSDGSEDSSLSGLKALVSNLDLYPNSDELLLQFTDSKYEGVICYLADNLPEYLLTSIMGTEFSWGKRRIEDRLRRIEEAKEAAEKNAALL